MDIDDNKLYRLLKPIGIGTVCVTSPGLIIGSSLKEAIERSGVKIEDVKFECVE